jgi:hypothetical protein
MKHNRTHHFNVKNPDNPERRFKKTGCSVSALKIDGLNYLD